MGHARLSIMMSPISASGYSGPSFDQRSNGMGQAQPERAHQACEYCRLRKRRCDGFGYQTCSTCKKHDVQCTYALKRPNRKDASIETMMQQIESMGKRLAACEAKAEPQEQLSVQPGNSATTTLVPQKLDIKADHYTGSHNLIEHWPTVRRLLEKASISLNSTYVMETEDSSFPTSLSASFSTEYDDDRTEQNSATTATIELDATSFHGFRVENVPSTPQTESIRGVKRSRESDEADYLHRDQFIHLFDSYVRNIHVMQPFLDLRHIERLLHSFSNEVGANVQMQRPDQTPERPGSMQERPVKRRRVANQRESQSNLHHLQATTRLENAICCLVLALGTICSSKEHSAQPEECRVQQFPEVVRHRSESLATPILEGVSSGDYFAGRQTTSEPESPSWMERRLSVDGMTNDHLSNPPGIEYYNMAKRYIGLHMEDEDLLQAQFYLLAALYQGQVGKVRQSMKWITMAGRTSLILLRRNGLLFNFDSDATTDMKFNIYLQRQLRPLDQLIVISAWTCIQLEGDILADLPLPSSGLAEYEENLPRVFNIPDANYYYERAVPDAQTRRCTSDGVSISYMSQLWLRQQLNLMQNHLYGKSRPSKSHEELREYLEEHQSMLDLWRKGLPSIFQWKDNDSPASDILTARLRAKYWGARVIATRPFLDYLLHVKPKITNIFDIQSIAISSDGQTRSQADVQLFEAIHGFPENAIIQGARRCVEATVQSTRAFDGIPHQLIVTNIFGTAHAQFGNMLVLLAAWPTLKGGKVLANIPVGILLRRTIAFLRSHATISRTCKIDCSILNDILRWMKSRTARTSANLYLGSFNSADVER